MTKVEIVPGICGFTAVVTAQADDDEQEVKVSVASGCSAISNMMDKLGDTFDAFEVCLARPGCGPLYECASETFPVHAGCPVIAGITKCIEAEAGLALKKDASIRFIEE